MTKFQLVVTLLVISSVQFSNCQSCFFQPSETLGYHCALFGGSYLSPNAPFTIGGAHPGAFNDLNVTRVVVSSIAPGTFRFIPSAILQRFVNLRYLDLSYTGIESIDHVTICNQLESITLNNNRIGNLSARIFQSCPYLREIQIESNDIHLIDVDAFGALPALQTINFRNNSITNLISGTFDALSDLRYVDLQYNNIRAVPENLFYNLAHLEHVHLTSNEIETIDRSAFRNLTSLHHLTLDNNLISEIGAQAFYNLAHLETLYLQNNSITRLSSSSFSPFPQLAMLRIDYNQINAVQRTFFNNFPNLQRLQAQGNGCTSQEIPPLLEGNFLVYFEECFRNFGDEQDSTPGVSTPSTSTTDAGSSIAVNVTLAVVFLLIAIFTLRK